MVGALVVTRAVVVGALVVTGAAVGVLVVARVVVLGTLLQNRMLKMVMQVVSSTDGTVTARSAAASASAADVLTFKQCP